jgi:hypothetical protein
MDIEGAHNGTLQNGAMFAPGMVDQAFSFDGASANVDVGSIDLPITFTIDAWIFPNSVMTFQTNQTILSKDDGSTARSYYFQLEGSYGAPFNLPGGTLVASVRNASGGFTQYRTSSGVITSGSWQHVAIVYDGSAGIGQKMQFYVNGVSYATSVIGPVGSPGAYDRGGTPEVNALSARIGIMGDAVGGPFSGLIDEVQLFNRTLTGAEIQAIYNAGSAGQCKTDLAATSLTWATGQGGVDYGYTISGADLPNGATGALYWSTDTDFNKGKHSLVANSVFTTATTAQTAPYTGHIDAATVGTPPTDADYQYLLFALNSDDAVTESDGPFSSDANDVQFLRLPYVDLPPLRLQGDFQTDPATGISSASGTILVGLVPSVNEAFVPNLRVEGQLSYDSQHIDASGTMYATQGGITAPLFSGNWEINVGQAETSLLSDNSSSLSNKVKVAGTTVSFDKLAFANTNPLSSADAHLELQGDITLPAGLDNVQVPISASNHMIIGSGGLSLNDKLSIPLQDLLFLKLYTITAKGLSLEYEPDDSLRIHGKLAIKSLFNAQADLLGDNYIRVQNGNVDIKGQLSLNDLTLANGWGLKEVHFFENTMANESKIGATLVMPLEPGLAPVEVSGELGFQDGDFNSVLVNRDNSNIPIGSSGLFFQRIQGEVIHVAPGDPNPVTLGGDFGLTYGPVLAVDLPSWAGGGFSGFLLRVDVGGSINKDSLVGNATIQVLSGVGTGTGQVVIDWQKGTFQADSSLSFFGGVISTSSSFATDTNINLTMDGSALLRLPTVPFTPLHGQVIDSAVAHFQYRASGGLTDDYALGYGTVQVPHFGNIILGVKVYYLLGTYDVITSLAELPPGVGGSARFRASEPAATADTESQVFYVKPGTPRLLLQASWQNNVGAVPIQVRSPTGAVYRIGDLGTSKQVSLIDALSDATSSSIGVLNPAPGNWSITLPGTLGLGTFQLRAFVDAPRPMIAITNLASNADGTAVSVSFDVSAIPSGATVSLFYASGPSASNSVLIADGLSTVGGHGSFTWYTSSVPPGAYYLYGMLDARTYGLAFGFSPRPVPVRIQTSLFRSPSVQAVRRFGPPAGSTHILLTFHSVFELSRANYPSNYLIIAPGPDNRFGTHDDQRIQIKSVSYDAATNTVSLVPARPLNVHRRYELIVSGSAPHGVSDMAGNPLDGSGTGQPGSNYETILYGPPGGPLERFRFAFATTLYRDILGRAPEADGFSYWLETLGSGVRPATVASLFWRSREHQALLSEHSAPSRSLNRSLRDALRTGRLAAQNHASRIPAGRLTLTSFRKSATAVATAILSGLQ